jgi:hypothetical protein
MTTRLGAWVTTAGLLVCAVRAAAAAPVLNSAEVRVAITSPISCEVTMEISISGATDIDHRVESFEGSRIDLLEVHGARRTDAVRTIGRTESLTLAPGEGPYAIRYRAVQGDHRANRCPIWLPAVPSDGRPGVVHLSVEIPSGTSAGTSMPAFAWNGERGEASLAHLPSVVRVPYYAAGVARPWDLSRLMDAIALTVFVGATAIWAWSVRR